MFVFYKSKNSVDIIHVLFNLLNGFTTGKIEKAYIPLMLHEIYRVGAAGLRNFVYTEKYNFCEYVKWGNILKKSIFYQ